jgi:hypothetical protein
MVHGEEGFFSFGHSRVCARQRWIPRDRPPPAVNLEKSAHLKGSRHVNKTCSAQKFLDKPGRCLQWGG